MTQGGEGIFPGRESVYLLRYLNVQTVEEALAIVTRYFDEAQLLPKTRLILEELLPGRANP